MTIYSGGIFDYSERKKKEGRGARMRGRRGAFVGSRAKRAQGEVAKKAGLSSRSGNRSELVIEASADPRLEDGRAGRFRDRRDRRDHRDHRDNRQGAACETKSAAASGSETGEEAKRRRGEEAKRRKGEKATRGGEKKEVRDGPEARKGKRP